MKSWERPQIGQPLAIHGAFVGWPTSTYLGRYSLADQSAQCATPEAQRDRETAPRINRWIIWFVSAGIFLPYTFGSTGKYVIALGFIPSVFAFFRRILQRRRNMKASDFFVWRAASTPVRQN
jgi:hypothetical protein